jgi:hypothetical protein
MTTTKAGSHWLHHAGATAIVLAATIPFVTKPLHIDDAADLQYVDQVRSRPSDPYGFRLDWDEGPHSAYENYHPPLKYYYHALWLQVFPRSEWSLHVSYLPFVAITAVSVMWLAQRFRCPPLTLTALWMLGPGYLPGQNAMLDVPVMALGLAATALFIRAVDRDRLGQVVLSGVLLGVALLTKYSAVVYLPVWAVYVALYGRIGHWVGPLAALVVIGVWCVATAFRYGSPHPTILLTGVAGHVGRQLAIGPRILSALVFLGGSMPLAILCVCVWHRSGFVAVAAIASAALVFWLSPPRRRVVEVSAELSPSNSVWWCWLAATGFSVLFVAGRYIFAARLRVGPTASSRHDDYWLVVWLVLAIAANVFGSPFLAMRRVVEASLPGWLLVLRRSESTPSTAAQWVTRMAVVMTVGVGYLVALADWELATAYRRFAAQLANSRQSSGGPAIWSHGYWGWWHYARGVGLAHYQWGGAEPATGEVFVVPVEVAKPAMLPDSLRLRARLAGRHAITGLVPIRVMHHQAGAGYYSAAWGPLPYAWSTRAVEVFHFFEVSDTSVPGGSPSTTSSR